MTTTTIGDLKPLGRRQRHQKTLSSYETPSQITIIETLFKSPINRFIIFFFYLKKLKNVDSTAVEAVESPQATALYTRLLVKSIIYFNELYGGELSKVFRQPSSTPIPADQRNEEHQTVAVQAYTVPTLPTTTARQNTLPRNCTSATPPPQQFIQRWPVFRGRVYIHSLCVSVSCLPVRFK